MKRELPAITANGRRRKATHLEILGFIKSAWAKVKSESIIKRFEKAGLIEVSKEEEKKEEEKKEEQEEKETAEEKEMREEEEQYIDGPSYLSLVE
jgi:ribosomal protein L14E/L6E/L27E